MPPVSRLRRGMGLAELLVALALSALLSAAGAAALLGIERYVRRTSSDDDARRVAREAEAVLGSDLRAAAPDSVIVRGDTAVDLLSGVALSVVCVASADALILPSSAASSGFPLTVQRSTPAAGDALAWYDAAAGWRMTRIDSVQSRWDGAGCSTAGGFRSAADSAARLPVLRVRVADATGAEVGGPVRIFRRGRYALVRGGDGTWGLAWRRCDAPAPCGSSQPVAGPLAAPAAGGLHFQVAADGATITVQVVAAGVSGPVATRRFSIALRGGDSRE